VATTAHDRPFWTTAGCLVSCAARMIGHRQVAEKHGRWAVPTALHDVSGYTDEALQVLRSTSTAMAGTATMISAAP
jgi:hypothetical protein